MSGGGPEDGTKRQELRALLLDFASENMEYTAEELRKSGGEKVAESLASSLEALKGGGDSAPAAQIVVDLCWEKLSNGGGWPTVGWREAYVFSLMAVALAPIETGDKSAEALESARKSMKDLDMALIMGGPGASDIVLAFVDCIEPLILSANKDGDKDEDSSSYIVSADVPPHAPSINEAFAVERVASISFADFKKKFFKTDTACVVTGAIESWPARGRWHDLRYFRDNFGHRTVPLELGRLENGRKKAGWREEATLLRDLIEQHLVPSNAKCRGRAEEANASASASSASAEAAAEAAAAAAVSDPDHEVAYLAQHGLFEQVPRLANDIAVPEYCACGDFAGANAWFGTAGTVTPLHHDSQDNLLAQVVGYKYIRLYDHLQTRFLYVSKGGRGEGISAQGNISPVNCEAPDHHAHPLLREAKYKEVLLGPGDMLFIPARHWHYVRSLSPSFSVNFWF